MLIDIQIWPHKRIRRSFLLSSIVPDVNADRSFFLPASVWARFQCIFVNVCLCGLQSGDIQRRWEASRGVLTPWRRPDISLLVVSAHSVYRGETSGHLEAAGSDRNSERRTQQCINRFGSGTETHEIIYCSGQPGLSWIYEIATFYEGIIFMVENVAWMPPWASRCCFSHECDLKYIFRED